MFQHKMPPRSHRPIVVRFMYRGKFKNIEVNPHAGFDALLEQVAAGWNIPVPIELEYIDTSNAETTILSRADDIPHVFALKYKWKVTVPKRASSPSRPGSTSPVLVPSPTRSPQLFSSSSLLSPHSTVNRMPTTLDRSSGADLRRDSVHDGTVPQNRDKWTELIPGDWKCKALVQTHPFFISYRQASESHVAKELYYKMKLALIDEQAVQLGGLHPSESSTDGLHPFLDVQCLSNGEQWGINFMAGLYNSGVIILLCSDAAMERMKHAQTSQDNVLLEVLLQSRHQLSGLTLNPLPTN
ncbi:hypothetical protein DFJ73DRAFT_84324 [Zopfochytrium polystomum]|nr:hypothetical protein DFJ73DRAFT_84324 [Zopfochytrium polystomum]